MLISMDGGFPEMAFGGFFDGTRCHLMDCDLERGVIYLVAESRTESVVRSYRCNLRTGQVMLVSESTWGRYPAAYSKDHKRVVLVEGYTTGDSVLMMWHEGQKSPEILYGVPLEERGRDEQVELSGFGSVCFADDERGLLVTTVLYEDTYGVAYLDLEHLQQLTPVTVVGLVHQGVGELTGITHLINERYLLFYNIDGCSWVYEAVFVPAERKLTVQRVLVGQAPVAEGVLESLWYERRNDRFAFSFSTAISPTQIYLFNGRTGKLQQQTDERVLGIPQHLLARGEDASFISHDGMRVSARLYLPAAELGFRGPRPVVYYIHGGPQSQERPDFAWFSMPLIQFLTLNGLAVFVPNVRGSTGYGLNYTKQVDRDWGGQDRLDHVYALQFLAKDSRLDVGRAGVVGRSYGGYMTLTLASRNPELWKGAVDMFGPFDLVSFSQRIPETWKPYFRIALGDPVEDREFLIERSPRTYMDQLACPMLVIQGKNDPRVVEPESRDLVTYLRQQGKQVDYLMFENEGHDVLKYENRVRCYNAITEFFKQQLGPI
jgi:pimeloyl-ACP methyl ester carboxylesterase